MNGPEAASHFEVIPTRQTLMRAARDGATDAINALVLRYYKPVSRYAIALARHLRNALEAGEEVTQQVMAKMADGLVKKWDPAKGRFRPWLKGVIRHAVSDFVRAQQRQQGLLRRLFARAPAEVPASDPEAEAAWLQAERWMFVNSALARLLDDRPGQGSTGDARYHLMKSFVEHPEWKVSQRAHYVSEMTPTACTEGYAGKLLHQERRRFATLLRQEVAHTLLEPTNANVEEEFRELGLFDWLNAFFPQPSDGPALEPDETA